MTDREARFFPFDRLGLRRNPFGSLTENEWLAVTVFPPVMRDLLAQNDCHSIQFTGDTGRGKTTLLLALRWQFVLRGELIPFEKLPEGTRRFTTALADIDGFALDEAQRLSWFERRRLFRHIGTRRLFVTTHEDLSGWFRRYGRPVTTISAADCMTRDHLANVLARRLEFFALDDRPPMAFSDEAVDYLWQIFGTHVRGMEHALYEFFQQRREAGIIAGTDLREAGF